jgi:EmrB/QacA subfamily drug resistance transporter
MLPMFMGVIDQTIVATALPAIAGDLGNVDLLSWVVVAYLVAATVAALVYGKLGDLFGRRRLMFVALGVFMVSSILCALAPTTSLLIIARGLQGLGGGGLLTLSQALIGETIPPRDRARYQGYLAAVGVTASSLGPVAGGFLTEHLGWQAIFLVNIPICILAFFLTFRLPIRQGTGGPFRFDFPGLALIAASVGSVLVLVQLARQFDMANLPLIAGLLAVAIIAGVLLVWQERRVQNPLLPLALIRNASIWRADALGAMFGATLISLLTFLPIYYRVIFGASPAEIGLLLLPMTAGTGIGSMLTGQIISRSGRTAIVPSIGLIVVVLLITFLAFFSPLLNKYELAWFLGVNAIFLGTVMAVVQLTVQIAAGATVLGSAAATVQFSRTLGSALGTATVGVVLFGYLAATDQGAMSIFVTLLQDGGGSLETFTLAQRTAIRADLLGAFRAAFLTIAAFAATGVVLAWLIPLRRIQDEPFRQ